MTDHTADVVVRAALLAERERVLAEIADDGDEKETLAQIDAIWVVARPKVETTNPELVDGIDTTVDMARTAVVRVRPADADKASQILDDLVERFDAEP